MGMKIKPEDMEIIIDGIFFLFEKTKSGKAFRN